RRLEQANNRTRVDEFQRADPGQDDGQAEAQEGTADAAGGADERILHTRCSPLYSWSRGGCAALHPDTSDRQMLDELVWMAGDMSYLWHEDEPARRQGGLCRWAPVARGGGPRLTRGGPGSPSVHRLRQH